MPRATPESRLPRWAYVPGKGKCRVLAYMGNGQWDLLTSRDERLYRNQSTFSFTKEKSK